MNDKLRAWEGLMSTKLTGTGRRGRPVAVDTLVVLSASGNTAKEPRSILRVSVHGRVVGLTGWVIGDTLDMEIKDGKAFIFRSDSGRRLCKSCGKRIYLRYSLPPHSLDGFPSGEGREVETAPGKMAFLLPTNAEGGARS